MNDIDKLVTDRLVPFRERLLDAFKERHPYLLSVLQAVLAERENKAGMQVVENGRVVGEYTFRLIGVKIVGTEAGKLDSGIQHPFLGLIKPYVIIEREAIEKLLNDEAALTADFAAVAKYFPDMTIKFLK